jgi:putative two-component system response regulator
MTKVLIVDDEKSLRITLGEFLRKEGYWVTTASDSDEAFLILKEENIDVVITDIIMPRISGIELLSKIRENFDMIQIIVMTGEPTVDTAIYAVRHGANEYLTKPIDKDSLIKAVGHAAKIKHMTDRQKELERKNLEYQKDLEKLVAQRTDSLQKTLQSVVRLISSVVELRDPYTSGHQTRVGNLAAEIAKGIDMDDGSINLTRIAGYLHDVGKIVIPTEILSKPGKLSRLEIELIKEHSFQGFTMLSQVAFPCEIAETIYQHHERLDGSGYPLGLKGDQISDEANILVIADVVEAMMSHRPYRPALGIDAALEEIEKNSGILYKPKMVAACVDLFRNKGYEIDDNVFEINFSLSKID